MGVCAPDLCGHQFAWPVDWRRLGETPAECWHAGGDAPSGDYHLNQDIPLGVKKPVLAP